MAEVLLRMLSRELVVRVAIAAAVLTGAGCATLRQVEGLIQPPRFSQSSERAAELRMIAPSADLPLGGMGVRLWARVMNPNPFGFTLGTLRGTLFLEGARGATADFPLGLPLRPGEESEVPLDLTLNFSDVPALAEPARRALNAQPIDYRLDGTIGVDAGQLGQPVFGPMTLMTGELNTR